MKESSGLQPAALEELRKTGEVLTQFGEDCDVDADGTIYIADRGANAVQVYAKEGRHLKTIPVNAPVSVGALPDGEVAVATFAILRWSWCSTRTDVACASSATWIR